uniref:Cytochrome c oxidase subunit 2 n=1 Tax=Phrynus sp. 1 SEM-2008 TaxID=507471 RepID=B2CKD5_9ARAC|nr:cytochrome oxidase subunit 2 [Phrynus sp. 1 SEM-2008]
MATWNNLSFQDSASPLMEQLIYFHDHTMIILIMITILISYMMINILFSKFTNRFLSEGQEIETFWTLAPAILLIFIAFPSLRLLYLLDESPNPELTLKIIGHQWYWSYEYSDFPEIEFDSYMIQDLTLNSFRLLDVDNRTILPFNTPIRFLITSQDVIHAWAIPSIGIKMDAIPGRLNQTFSLINRPGLFFGQCSEICGANHSFMPIVLESINTQNFINWIKTS